MRKLTSLVDVSINLDLEAPTVTDEDVLRLLAVEQAASDLIMTLENQPYKGCRHSCMAFPMTDYLQLKELTNYGNR